MISDRSSDFAVKFESEVHNAEMNYDAVRITTIKRSWLALLKLKIQ
jgi:hypothetical protein